MLVIGTVVAGAGFLLLAATSNVWLFSLAYLVLISPGAMIAFGHATSAAVNKWFSRFRVRALAVHDASGSLGSTLLLPVIGLIIATFSWEAAALFAAVAYLVIILPFTSILKESPESIGLLPDGATEDEVESARKASVGGSAEARRLLRFYDVVDYSVGEALRTSSFWFLLAGTMFRQVAESAIQVHIIAILIWKGQDQANASLFFALWLGINVPAKLAFGYIGDRASKSAVLAAGMVLNTLALALFLPPSPTVWLLLAAVLLGGAAEGVTPVNWGAIGDYFGRRYFATLRGIVALSFSWASLVMPVASGLWFDRYHSYAVPLAVAVTASAISAALYALMRRPKPPARFVPRPGGADAGADA